MIHRMLYFILLLIIFSSIRSNAFEPLKEDWDALRIYAEALSKPIDEDRNYTSGLMRALEYWENTKKWHDHRASINQPLPPQQPIPKGADRPSLDKRNALCDQLAANVASVRAMIENLPEQERNRPNYVRLRRMLVTLRKSANKLEEDRLKLEESVKNTMFDVHGFSRGSMEILTTETLQAVPVGPPPKGIQLTWRDFPRIDGSTTAQPLSTLIACRVLGLDCAWKKNQVL